MRYILVLTLASALLACGDTEESSSTSPVVDASPDAATDSAGEDVSSTDTVSAPDSAADTADEDASIVDGATEDIGVSDTATPDAGTPDTATPDGGTPDTGAPDAATPDAVSSDTVEEDISESDSTSEDVAVVEDVAPPEGCTANNDGEACDDGDPCTMDDACDAGECTGWPKDVDQDGYVDESCGGMDCDDEDYTVFPGAIELCDGKKNDCTPSPVIGEQSWESESFNVSCGYCNFKEFECEPGTEVDYYYACWGLPIWDEYIEICGDGLDNDCDGEFDEASCQEGS